MNRFCEILRDADKKDDVLYRTVPLDQLIGWLLVVYTDLSHAVPYAVCAQCHGRGGGGGVIDPACHGVAARSRELAASPAPVERIEELGRACQTPYAENTCSMCKGRGLIGRTTFYYYVPEELKKARAAMCGR
jgi:hypothetical protein